MLVFSENVWDWQFTEHLICDDGECSFLEFQETTPFAGWFCCPILGVGMTVLDDHCSFVGLMHRSGYCAMAMPSCQGLVFTYQKGRRSWVQGGLNSEGK